MIVSKWNCKILYTLADQSCIAYNWYASLLLVNYASAQIKISRRRITLYWPIIVAPQSSSSWQKKVHFWIPPQKPLAPPSRHHSYQSWSTVDNAREHTACSSATQQFNISNKINRYFHNVDVIPWPTRIVTFIASVVLRGNFEEIKKAFTTIVFILV